MSHSDHTSSPSSTPSFRVSRRDFLRAAGAGTAVVAGSAAAVSSFGAVPFTASRAAAQGAWDQETDVVVVGSGCAAYTAAVTAFDAGSQVVMLEKATAASGTTIKSGGGHWTPNNSFMQEEGLVDPREDALKYMARYSYPKIYNPDDPQLGLPKNEYDLIATFYDTAQPAVAALEAMGAMQSVMQRTWIEQLPTPDYMEHFPENKAPRGRLIQPLDPEGNPAGGVEMIRQYQAAAEEMGIPLLLGHRVRRLVLNDAGEVVGVEATTEDGQTVAVRARKAVVFGSGGFSHDAEMVLNFQRGPIFGGCAVPTNEGDFVRIAGAVGAKLGNMTGAFHGQIVLEQALNFSSVPSDVFFHNGDSTVQVNKFGLRVVNEKRNYNDRTQVHFNWDPVRGEWTNMLLFYIYDQRTADYWNGAYPIPVQGTETPYLITGETWDELTTAIDERLTGLASQIGGFRLDPAFAENLAQTVARFNEFARAGVDADFQRGDFPYDREWPLPPTAEGVTHPSSDQPNPTMYPLSDTGPYYAIIVAGGTLDTNGGPVINPKAQVLNTEDQPIRGLYGAGNCVASPCASAYWGGGATLGNAVTYGYIAGLNAAAEPEKTV